MFGFLLLGEGLGPFGLLGAALIAAGLALSLQEQRLEEDATTPVGRAWGLGSSRRMVSSGESCQNS